MLLAIANRPIDSNTTFTTGGDVSRFQRRTVPAEPQQADQASAALGKALGQALAAPAERRRLRPARSSASLAAIMSPSFRWELANMKTRNITRRARLGTALAALAIGLGAVARAGPGHGSAAALRVGHLSPDDAGPAVGRRRPDGQSAAQRRKRLVVEPDRSPTSRSTARASSICSARTPARRRSSRPPPTARSSMPPTSASARTSARSTRCCIWRCRKPNIQVTHGRPDRGPQPAPSPRPTTLRRPRARQAALNPGVDVTATRHCKIVPVNRLQVGNAAAGQAEGPHRRGEPHAAQEDRRQPARPATRPAASCSASARAIRARSCRQGPADPATGAAGPDVSFNNLVGGTTLGLFGKLLRHSTCSARSTSPQNDGLVDARSPSRT